LFVEQRIKEEIEKTIKKYGTSNPKKIIGNMKNVDFAFEPLSKNLNGYYIYVSEKKQIMRVHDDLEQHESQYNCFHELTHKILGHKGIILLNYRTTIGSLKEEYEADLGATYFFILHNGINRENINDFTIPERAKGLIYKYLE
jgi:Zn-dependent peptidase ImmA (M78 family)